MAVFSGTNIVNDGLVFHYDMDNSKKSWIGRPTTNTINTTTAPINRYNNPGFSGNVTNTGLTYRGAPIYELTFIPQNSSFISRLASTEGFGAFHSMGIPLQADTRYMASIYVRSDHPLQNSANEGFSNGYSNIPGWNQNGTTSTRYKEDGWTRLYSQYFNSVNGYSTRVSAFQNNFVVNTTSTQTIDVNFTVPSNGSGISNFDLLHALVSASPSIINNGGITGLSIVNHGLDTTSFTKLSWPNTIKLKSSDLPFNYFVRLSVPSTGGVNTTIAMRANFTGYYTALTDNKFWKLTFNTTNVTEGQILRTYWCAPMIEEHDTVWPSTFINGTRSNTEAILDLTKNNTITVNNLAYNANGTFEFNGNTSYIVPTTPFSIWNKSFTISQWCYFLDDSRGILVGDFSTANAINTAFEKHTSRRLRLYWDASPDIFTGNNVLDINAWQYLTVVRDKSNSQVRFYTNGNLVHTYNGTLSDKIATVPHRIGADGRTGTTVVNGNISSTQIYDSALTPQEIQQNFEATRSRYGI
jgi:hypothetical protein